MLLGIEIRVRIIVEAVTNKNFYLSHNYLDQGTSGSKCLPKAFAMYSDEYVPPGRLENEDIENIKKITKDKTYMGIWQMFALASVLCRCVFSVYPQLGNQVVRRDLHRLIKPRQQRSQGISFIMWSSTRKDLTHNNWIPNHFVAVMPIEIDDTMSLNIQRWKLMRQRKLVRDKSYQQSVSRNNAIHEVKIKHVEVKTGTEQSTDMNKPRPENVHETNCTEAIDSEKSNKEENGEEVTTMTFKVEKNKSSVDSATYAIEKEE